MIYYNDVINAQPDTAEATYAKTRIEELKAKYGEDYARTIKLYFEEIADTKKKG